MKLWKKLLAISAVVLSILILLLMVSDNSKNLLRESSFFNKHNHITVGYLKDDQSENIAFNQELEILDYVSSRIKIDLDFTFETIAFNQKDQLIEAYTQGDIDSILSIDNLDVFNLNAIKTVVPTKIELAVYMGSNNLISAPYQIGNLGFGYIDKSFLTDMTSYYNVLEINGMDFKTENDLIKAYLSNEIKYALLLDKGQMIEIGKDNYLYKQFNINPYQVDINFYHHEDYHMAYEYFNRKYKDLNFEWTETTYENYQVYNAKKEFLNSIDLESKQYIDTKKVINILVANNESPLVLKNKNDYYGILVSAMTYISNVTSLDVHYFTINDLDNGLIKLDQLDLLTTKAYKAVESNAQPYIKTNSVIPSSLIVVGLVGNTQFTNLWDLATGDVSIVENEFLEKSLLIMFPRSNVINNEDANQALKMLISKKSHYAIVDEFEFQYYMIKNGTDSLKQVGYYNRNNDVQLMVLESDTKLVELINKSMNHMNAKAITLMAIEKIVKHEDNQIEYIALYLIIFILLVIMIFLYIKNVKSKNEQIKLSYLSNHDSLTESLNLRGLGLLMKKTVIHENYFLILMDIRKFKRINIERGFETGNLIIKSFTSLLESTVQKDGFIARNGGDEFVLVLKESVLKENKDYIEDLYKQMSHYLMSLSGVSVALDFGVSYMSEGSLLLEVFNEAEGAINKQKELLEAGITYFTKDLHEVITEERKLSKDIVNAFESEEFVLHYQPQVSSKDGKTVGLEALVRWKHPENGLMYPDRFLHIIKKENLTKQLDYYVLRKAIGQYKEWVDSNYKLDKLAINITPITLLDDNFADRITKYTNRYDVNPSCICIEITEDFEISDQSKLESTLSQLKKIGFSIAMDDFGTGYSSLNYIVKYPIDIIKIDRSLIENITTSKQDFDFYCGIIDILSNLGKKIVCEGVEDEEQLRMIASYRDLTIQGYYYSKPLDKESVIQFIK